MKNMSEAKLTVKIENKRPIELIDFTDSFESIGQQYYKFMNESENIKHTNVLFYWDSAKYDDKSKSINKGCIDSLWDKPLRVIFDNPTTKLEMFLKIENNPFHYDFVVDVEILTVQNTPNVYKIIRCNDFFLK